MVKYIYKGWRYKYLDGVKLDEIPNKVLENQKIKEFVNTWGNGTYEILDSKDKRKVKKNLFVN